MATLVRLLHRTAARRTPHSLSQRSRHRLRPTVHDFHGAAAAVVSSWNNVGPQQVGLRRSSTSVLSQLLEYKHLGYESAKANYNPVVPEHFNFARDFVDEWARRDEASKETHVAFWYVGGDERELKWTYPQLSEFSQKAANALVQTGANEDWRRCILMLPKVPEWWTINLAIQRLGAQAVHATTQLTAKDIEYRLRVSKAECVVADDKIGDIVDSVAPKCPHLKTRILVSGDNTESRPGWHNFRALYEQAASSHQCRPTRSDDALNLFFTSGTTSMPKLVVHTHANLGIGHFFMSRHILELNRGRVMWNVADPGWVKTALSGFFVPWSSGATVFVHHMPKFDPAIIVKTLQTKAIHALCAPPTVYRMLVALPGVTKFPALSRCSSSGEPLNSEVMRRWRELTGLEVREGYGQTETPALIGRNPEQHRPGAMGQAYPHLDVTVVDDDGVELAPETEGNIALRVKPVRPLGLFKEYENEPEKTAACFVGDYYITGDLGRKDADGYFYFATRKDDVINSSAYRIGPFEVESALQEHPDVLESAAVGSPDPIRGEVVKAFVVLKPAAKTKDRTALAKELQEHVKRVTAPYKYPRKIEFVDSLPKTISGKIKRAELRQLERAKVLG